VPGASWRRRPFAPALRLLCDLLPDLLLRRWRTAGARANQRASTDFRVCLPRYCGTFGRTCAFEGQYAIHSGHGLRNFSEEQLVECIGWTKDQYGYVAGTADGTPGHGFEDMAVYPPYVEAGYKDTNPPIPGHPCKYDKSKIVVGTDNGWVRLKCLAFVFLAFVFLAWHCLVAGHGDRSARRSRCL
jgi:hypothetical protein